MAATKSTPGTKHRQSDQSNWSKLETFDAVEQRSLRKFPQDSQVVD